MTRSRLVTGVVVVLIVLIGVFVATNTEWEEYSIPTPPKGEAVTNPFYAAQRLSEALGATARREHSLIATASDSVVVVSVWHWDVIAQRRDAMKQWVEGGGRLVVDRNFAGARDFEDWSGVKWDFNSAAYDTFVEKAEARGLETCAPAEEVVPAAGASYTMCDRDFTFVSSARAPQWALRDANGHQALRVGIGHGSVTVINGVPFTHRGLFDGDHSALFVAATQLQRGDAVLFLTENDYPSLFALLWRYGSPPVALALLLIALLLWRGAVRFGPMIGAPERRRRSMADQIRGSGLFALKFGEGQALHLAAVRALDEEASRRIPAYSRLSKPQRAAALGHATGMDGRALLAAIDAVGKRRPKELPNTLAVLEAARRQLLLAAARPSVHRS